MLLFSHYCLTFAPLWTVALQGLSSMTSQAISGKREVLHAAVQPALKKARFAATVAAISSSATKQQQQKGDITKHKTNSDSYPPVRNQASVTWYWDHGKHWKGGGTGKNRGDLHGSWEGKEDISEKGQ